MSKESIQVLVRVRPLTEPQEDDPQEQGGVIELIDNDKLAITNAEGNRTFQCAFDHVLGPQSSQDTVYGIVKSCTS